MRRILLFSILMIGFFLITTTNVLGKHNIRYINTNKFVHLDTLHQFKYKEPIKILNPNPYDLKNIQVKINIDDKWIGWNYVQPDGRDIRFTLDNGITKIPYWIEKWDYNNKNAVIWVKIPSIPKDSQVKIYIHYGNPNAQSESNGNQVFEFFDDFTTFNTTKWTKYDKYDKLEIINNTILKITPHYISFIYTFKHTITNGILETKWMNKYYGDAGGSIHVGLLIYTRIQSSDLSSIITSSGSWGYGLHIFYTIGAPPKKVWKFFSNSESHTGSTSGVKENYWYLVKTELKGNNIKAELIDYKTGQTKYSVFTTNTTTNYNTGGIGIGGWNYEYFDWIRVRKYVDKELTSIISQEITTQTELTLII